MAAHLLTQLQHRRARALTDGRLAELRQELAGYPGGTDESVTANGVVLPLRYRRSEQELALFSITAAVDTAAHVTVEALAIETFYPTDKATARAFQPGCLPLVAGRQVIRSATLQDGPPAAKTGTDGRVPVRPAIDQPGSAFRLATQRVASLRGRGETRCRRTHNQLISAHSLP